MPQSPCREEVGVNEYPNKTFKLNMAERFLL